MFNKKLNLHDIRAMKALNHSPLDPVIQPSIPLKLCWNMFTQNHFYVVFKFGEMEEVGEYE